MMSTSAKKLSWAGIAALLMVGLVGCAGSDAGPGATPPASSPVAEESVPAAATSNTALDAATETDSSLGTRSDLTKVLEEQFENENAKARWEADTFHMSLDGERDAPINGKYCRTFKTILGDVDGIVLEFPDGTIPCTEIPGA